MYSYLCASSEGAWLVKRRLHSFLISTRDGDKSLALHPCRFTSEKGTSLSPQYAAEWASGPVCTF